MIKMKITEICKIRSGTSFPRKPKNHENGDCLILESFCVDQFGEIDYNSLVNEDSSTLKLPSTSLSKNDILIRAKGANHQAIKFSGDYEVSPVFPTSYFLVLSLKECNLTTPDFLVWLLNQPECRIKMSNLAGGSTVKHLTKTRLSTLDISLPPIHKQTNLLHLAHLLKEQAEISNDILKLKDEYHQASINSYLGED